MTNFTVTLTLEGLKKAADKVVAQSKGKLTKPEVLEIFAIGAGLRNWDTMAARFNPSVKAAPPVVNTDWDAAMAAVLKDAPVIQCSLYLACNSLSDEQYIEWVKVNLFGSFLDKLYASWVKVRDMAPGCEVRCVVTPEAVDGADVGNYMGWELIVDKTTFQLCRSNEVYTPLIPLDGLVNAIVPRMRVANAHMPEQGIRVMRRWFIGDGGDESASLDLGNAVATSYCSLSQPEYAAIVTRCGKQMHELSELEAHFLLWKHIDEKNLEK